MDSLLDTNVLSQRTKVEPDERCTAWLKQTEASELYLSVISLAEIAFGIEELDAGKKRQNLEAWLTSDIKRGFAGRILGVDERIAEEAGRLTSKAKKIGTKPQFADVLIAATARVHGLRVATLNRKHFEPLGVEIVEL